MRGRSANRGRLSYILGGFPYMRIYTAEGHALVTHGGQGELEALSPFFGAEFRLSSARHR